MSVDEKLDQVLLDLSRLRAEQRTTHKAVDEIHIQLGVLDERSQQHEKRMDRQDKKAGVLGGITGGVTGGFLGAIVAAVRSMWNG